MSRVFYRRMMICFILITVLSACSRTKVIDQISIVQIIGYDSSESGGLDGTLLYPDYTKSEHTDSLEIRKVSGDTSSMILQKSNEKTKNPIELSKTLVIIFGKELAKKGVGEVIGTVVNNPLVGTNVQIAVAPTTARDLINGIKDSGALSVEETIVQNYKMSHMPQTNSHIFLNDFYGEGRDPYTPIIDFSSEKRAMVNGLAIWKDDQFKLALNNHQSLIFGLLDNFYHQGIVEVPIEKQSKNGKLVFRNLKNKSKWKVIKVGDNPEIKLNLKISTRIREYPNWIHLGKEGDIGFIKRKIQKKINQDVTDLIQLFQENNVDPLGIGDILRAHDKSWNEKSFYEKEYQKLKVVVDTDVRIIQSGLRR
jgi:spore germination protein